MRGPQSEVVVVALLGNSKKRGFWGAEFMC